MGKTPSKIENRISAGIKKFKPILESAKDRDVGESDTVTIVVEMLAEIFGYDKFLEITSEHAIRGTFCDLAIKVDHVLQMLIEVKAIGLDLKDQHVKQAVDYATNAKEGVDWVILTNGRTWRVYKVIFAKPIEHELVVEIDFLKLEPKSPKDVESLYLIAKEGWQKSVLGDYHDRMLALNRFFLGTMILSDPILEVIRRELRRVSPDVRIDADDIKSVLTSEVIKREVLEGDKADEARKRIARAANKPLRVRTSSKVDSSAETNPHRRDVLKSSPADEPATDGAET